MRAPATDRTVSGLRTRYFPRSRIGHGLVSMAPWIDVVLVVLFCVVLETKFVVRPGVTIELPEAPLQGGSLPGPTAVVMSVPSGVPGQREEIVIFDDNRYRVEDGRQMANLERALAKTFEGAATRTLIVEADRKVSHGTLVRLYAMARSVGLGEVTVAAREAAAAEGEEE